MIAVVTDVKYRMTLSLIRDLHDENIKIIACHSGSGRPFAFLSKGVFQSYCLPDLKVHPDQYIDELYNICRRLSESGQRPVLLPVGAATLALLCRGETRALFEEVCGLCLPTAQSLDLANDKARLAELASNIAVPTPKSYIPKSPDDFFEMPYPLVVKPVCGEKQGLSAENRYAIVRTPSEAQRAYSNFTFDNTPPVMQDYLDGGGYGFSVLAQGGQIINSICHKRLREYPLSGGPSTCCTTADGDFLRPYAQKLVKALNFTGLAMIEFKLDSKGLPYLLEINPRIWGTFPLTRLSKSSIAYDWFALAAGLPPKARPPQPNTRMYYLPSDLRRSLSAIKSGRLSLALSPVGDWLSPRVKEGVFDFSDAKASFAYIASYFRRGVR